MKAGGTAAATELTAPHLRALRWVLVVSFAVMGVAIGWRTLLYEDAVFSHLFMARGWPERDALRVSHGAAVCLVAASLAAPWRRAWPLVVAAGVWMGALAVLDVLENDPRPVPVLAGRAVRVLGPLALGLLLAFPRGGRVPWSRERLAVALLGVAAAATFAGHGLEALAHRGAFLDYVFAAGAVVGVEVEQTAAERVLTAIGIVDLVVAAALLLARGRVRLGVAAWMAGWGLLTAASRTVHSGSDGVLETALRLPNGGVPLALLAYWALLDRRAGGGAG